MKKFLYVSIFCLLLSGSFFAGSWFRERETARRITSERPLDPQNEDTVNRSPTPGKRVSLPLEMEGAGEEGVADSSFSMPPGTVRITSEKQQTMGVRLGPVEKKH